MSGGSNRTPRPTRRAFLIGTASLTIGFEWGDSAKRASAAATAKSGANFVPNAFLRIGSDRSVTVISKHVEMGQGSYTGIATIIAEELDADWARIRVESAPVDARRYANLAFGTMQITAGSSAMANSWMQLREAGAKTRAILLAAAAKQWQIPISELTVHNGIISDSTGTHRAAFGELVKTALSLPVPSTVKLKDPKDFKLIGRPTPRVDAREKCNGTALFTMDVVMPGMLVALLERPPLFGATLRSFDATAASAVPGVVKVVQVPRGVAVIAKDFWSAKKGRDALIIDWNDTHAEKRSSTTIMQEYRRLADQPALSARKEGNARAALDTAARRISANFEFPFLAHAPMEPLDAVVKLTADRCEIWAGAQFQTADQANAAHAAGLDPQEVSIHTLYAGGSFGRRANPGSDYIVEAVSVANAYGTEGTPIKLVWTREDDIRGGQYRPMYFHKLEAGLGTKGEVTAWRHVIVGQSILGGTLFDAMVKDGIDFSSVEGATNLPYAIPNIAVELSTTEVGVPVSWWRVVGSSHTTFVVEAFIDELAHAAGEDGFAFRARLLEHRPRVRRVLELAASKAGWNTQSPPRRKGRGIALTEAFNGTVVAQVAEVSVDESGQIKVDRVVCAVDCGTPINPDVITAQMEGGIGFGLGAALYGAISLKDGRIEQSNFDGYRVLRMNEMPKIEVHIVPSTAPPTGVGEPAVAPIGPAVAHAIFAATGRRSYVFPLVKPGISA
jgi:isoquinoline 1-oxidoreductase beta subunit